MAHQFDPEVISAICRYMNDDSMAATMSAIASKGRPEFDEKPATLLTFDGDGMDLEVAADDGPKVIRVDWLVPITTRDEVRSQLFALYERAVFG
ncbi:MAG: DUF2470 domain-containing protein [Agromyces sp.]